MMIFWNCPAVAQYSHSSVRGLPDQVKSAKIPVAMWPDPGSAVSELKFADYKTESEIPEGPLSKMIRSLFSV